MLADYKDIVDTINSFRRDDHSNYAGEYSAFPTGCTGDYKAGTPCSCTVAPQWYDENGCPRYAPHHPSLGPVYADEVVLLEIACQACGMRFQVQMTQAKLHEQVMATVWARHFGIDNEKIPPAWEGHTLAAQVRDGIIHYGDPPRHCHRDDVPCCAGDTMDCDDLRVLEFWRRDRGVREWVRVPELEVALPDAAEVAP